MIICPSCRSQEPDGTIFCSDCGVQLLQPSSIQTNKLDSGLDDMSEKSPRDKDLSTQSGTWISLHLLDSGHILAFSERLEFTLGRLSDNQPIEPDIDLSPYKAFDNGVSRLHAVIRQNDGNVSVMDLGSSNGTYVNGIRLMPNVPLILRHGDILSLGKLKMQIALS
jgi:hypothetical protein